MNCPNCGKEGLSAALTDCMCGWNFQLKALIDSSNKKKCPSSIYKKAMILIKEEDLSILIRKYEEVMEITRAFNERRGELYVILYDLIKTLEQRGINFNNSGATKIEIFPNKYGSSFYIKFHPPYSDFDILIESDRHNISDNQMRVKMRLVEATESKSQNKDQNIELSFPLYETIESENKINLIANVLKMLDIAW